VKHGEAMRDVRGGTTRQAVTIPNGQTEQANHVLPRVPAADWLVRPALAVVERQAGRDWTGRDPYDVLSSPWASSLISRQSVRAGQALTQVTKRFPLPLQGVLRTPRHRTSHAMGYCLQAVSYLHRLGALPRAAELADSLLSYLNAQAWRDGDAAAWALPFPYVTRFGFTEAGTPNVVTTEAVVSGLVDAVQAGLTSDMSDARGGARFVTRYLTSDFQPEGWFRYTPHGGDDIINGCALAVKSLLRVHEIDADETLRQEALAAARSIARLQRADGSWPYSTKVGKGWVDGFHTGFVLEALSLAVCACDEPDEPLRPALARGLRYLREHLLDEQGRAFYYPERPWPLSAMCAAQALQTICSAYEAGEAELSEAEPVARTTLRLFVRSDGRVAYQRHAFMTDWREFPRWAAGPVAAALARYAWMTCRDQQRSALVTDSAE